MAALGCSGDMAAVMGAVEQIAEYVQVMIGEDGEQVVVVQEGGEDLLRPVQELSSDLLHSISQSDTVFYVQPDGSLVPGGRLHDVGSGVRLLTAVEADHPGVRLVTAGHEVEGDHPGVRLVTAGHEVEGHHPGVRLVTAGHGVEGDHPGVRLVSGGHELEGDHPGVRLATEGHIVEADHPEMRLATEGHEEKVEPSEERLVTGDHIIESDHSDIRLVAGGQEVEADQSEVRLVTGGHGVEDEHPEMRLVTGGRGVEADQSEERLVTGIQIMEHDYPEMRLETGVQVEEAVENEGHEMPTVQSAMNLVTRGQVGEVTNPGMILVPRAQIEETVFPEVNLEPGGHVVEAVQSEMNLVNGGQVQESVPLESNWVNGSQDVVTGGDLVEEDVCPDVGMVTALNLTKEAAQRSQTTEVSQVPTRVPVVSIQGIMPAAGVTTNTRLPTFPSAVPILKDAAQQLKTVAHHVALREGDTIARILSHKELKSFRIQVPSLQTKKSADPVVLNLSTVHMKNASLLGTQVVHIKSLSESGGSPLVVNSSSLESPIQILVRQAQLKPRTPDLKKNAGETFDEQQSCIAHPQNGARASCAADQKKGQKRKKAIKIKTRSGRISRPPKHKAKDYKFLKVGDLIQGSTSDSEDLSEASTDEEEKGAKERAPCDLPPYTVRNALFQCQTCEKSYMGKGGLSRHYRLYPSHGQMEPPLVSDVKKNGESGAGGQSLPSEPKKPTPRPRKRLLEDPLNPDNPSLPTLVTDGFEFVPVSSTCRGRRQMTGRKFGRLRKMSPNASSEENALTAKEIIQRCEDADIKEHIAPCFSERLSVYDFLLVKIRQEHPDKPLFPQLYKELENLHSMVRVLAQEYFGNGGAGKTLEVADSMVAASLGISAEKIVKVSPPVTISVKEEQRTQSETENNECLVREMMPPSKRLKLEEPGSVTPTTVSAPESHEQQQRTDLAPVGNESLVGNDTSFDATINCTEQVTETSLQNVIEEEAENLHVITDAESIPCDIAQSLVETAPPFLIGSPELGDSTLISVERPEETSYDAIQTEVLHVDTGAMLPGCHTDQLPCPQASATDSALPSDAPPTTGEGFQDTFMPPDIIAGDQCTQAFGFHHGQGLMYVHSTEEAVVIYDSTASPADPHMDPGEALVEKE